ncbi:acetyl-CoA carboxylase [Peribacillus butanolivorans]|jgi:acetyl-CoA carboxylase biotin carboxyl carrier protein|uniref:Biotin carboxyl carrier protein of acetyl-CoA carboxylase n=1 Tax=Peribacillus butanolivorans TaxID=421767 RepID=A0AAX0S3P4_9BACI|nr:MULTISPECIES: acetyl-CoA carboxylase [Peribacillus]AXN39732.1 acetyl-CoA carboxylase biotin carboxyl carrier protein subunit [Peribacillus butanolivorans]KON67790.1 biotin attachment protein [Peribacillus butanolivorans]MBK5445110.1 biotin carboxyl carrier domain-containing protein [Peribacillus sp. TH24]MBK5460169.1 biotin carboxyl carrier domain-containing protein [Peribacillus sp. TH27]MBK5481983.1 biotin carboxyl carrier domain-containing protein [Peribacillus sp. TH16]
MAEQKTVLSPIPGVFYRKPAPDKDVYVKEGNTVKTGDVLAMVEVMKNFYEIKAETDGVLAQFFVEDEDLLDAGQEIAVIIEQ